MALDKKGNITINEWNEGIGISPYTGFGDMVNVDIHSEAGEVSIAPAPTKISGSTVTDTPLFGVEEGSTFWFGSDDGIYDYTPGSDTFSEDTSAAEGDAGVVWKEHLIYTENRSVSSDVNVHTRSLSGGATYNNDWWQVDNNRADHVAMLVGQDDTVYIGHGNIVSSLQEAAGQTFDPSTGATYTQTNEALDLPSNYQIQGLAELGKWLLIYAQEENSNKVAIFPWDRVSSSFNIPQFLSEQEIGAPLSHNNQTYFIAGKNPRIMVSNLTTMQDAVELEPLEARESTEVVYTNPNAASVVDGQLLFGVSTDDQVPYCGVYGYKNGALARYETSTGNDSSVPSQSYIIGFITAASNGNFYVGWDEQDSGGDTYGIDRFGQNDYLYTGYKARIESPMYMVGNARNKRSYQWLDIQLSQPLASGQGVRIKYRDDLNDSWTTIGTYDFATYGAVAQISDSAKIKEVSQVQIRIELTTGASTTTSPRLRNVMIS